MARTRRSVENAAVLILSLIVSTLMFYSLMRSIYPVGSASGKKSNPIAVFNVLQSDESSDRPASEFPSENSEISEYSDNENSGNSKELHALQDAPGMQRGDYLPLSALTQRPIVLQDVDPELPQSLRGLQPQSVRLLLLINEYGDIDQIKLESAAALPTAMLDELRRHFQVMRFVPGQIEERAVRSALRISVRLHP